MEQQDSVQIIGIVMQGRAKSSIPGIKLLKAQ